MEIRVRFWGAEGGREGGDGEEGEGGGGEGGLRDVVVGRGSSSSSSREGMVALAFGERNQAKGRETGKGAATSTTREEKRGEQGKRTGSACDGERFFFPLSSAWVRWGGTRDFSFSH